jgi:hypothetical protein
MPSAKPKLGAKYMVLSGTFPHLEEGNGLNAGKAALKGIIASHGGIVDTKVRGRTNLPVIGNHPGRTKVRDAEHRAIQIGHIFTLEMYLHGVMTFKELIGTAPPEITKYSASFSPNPLPEAQEAIPTRGTTTQGDATPATPPTPLHALPVGSNTNGTASTESDASVQLISPPQNQGNEITLANAEGRKRNVVLNNPIFKKRRDPISPPTATGITTQATNFVNGTVVTPSAETRSTGSRGRRPLELPTWTTVVTIEIRCLGKGDIRVMVPDLLFEGLKTLEEEDKDVCFLYPDNFADQPRKRNDMPAKFQCIYENWSAFEEPLAKIQSKLKKGKLKFFRLSMMLGSSMEPKDLLRRCVMDWNNTQKNGGKVKITYKQMQVLQTSKKIVLFGVPTDVDSKSLGSMLRATMEEVHITMVNKNPSKFGAIDKTPRFALSMDFVKNTPYKERSDDDKFPFWAKTPWHLECRKSDEGPIKAILSFMYRSSRMARILGGAAFHHLNPGPDAMANEHNINAGIVTRHTAMIQLMGRVNLRGLKNLDRPALLQKFDDKDPTKLVMVSNKLVRDVMMRECRADKTLVWCLLTHNREHEWVGYYRKGVGNDSHQKYTVCWSGSLSAHLHYFLLCHSLDAVGINQLIKQSFDYNAIVDAANAVQIDGKVVSREQAAAEQKLEAFDKKNSWVDISLGQTPAQQWHMIK